MCLDWAGTSLCTFTDALICSHFVLANVTQDVAEVRIGIDWRLGKNVSGCDPEAQKHFSVLVFCTSQFLPNGQGLQAWIQSIRITQGLGIVYFISVFFSKYVLLITILQLWFMVVILAVLG